jgi:hypothetical protein
MFKVGSCVVKRGSGATAVTFSWDNGLSADADYTGTANDMAHGIGSDASDTVTGVKTTTATLSDAVNNNGLSCALIVFDTIADAAFDFPLPLPHTIYRKSGRFL